MYSNFEERYGLISHSVQILERAIQEFTEPDLKFEILNLLLAKTT